MRKALNSNPVVQAAAVGLLVLVVGFMLVTRLGGSSNKPAAPTEVQPPATGSAVAPTTPGAVATPDATGAVPVAPGIPAPEVSSATGFEAGPGLPKAVVDAYDAGKVVVLLVVRNSGIDDNKVKSIVESLRGRNDVAVFTTRASGIADYSRIAQGAQISRVPALVVIRPKNLAEGSLPSATVSYGFRNQASVNQKVEDALYKGRSDLPYYPK